MSSVLETSTAEVGTTESEILTPNQELIECCELRISRSLEPADPIEGRLISLQGSQVKFSCSVPIACGEALVLDFQSDDGATVLSLEVSTKWDRAVEGEWIVGGEATHGISESMQHSLALSGFIDRRTSERFSANIPIQTRRSGQASRQPATILDFSKSGFRLLMKSEPPNENESFKTFFAAEKGDEVDVVAEVRWVLQDDDYSQVGCQVSAQSESAFQQLISQWRLED